MEIFSEMNFVLQLSTAVTFVGIIFLQYQDEALAVAEERPCSAIMAEVTKAQLNGIAACSKTMKFKNGKDKAKKMTCILKCVMKKEHLLSPTGQVDKTQLEMMLETRVPPSLQQKVNDTLTPCLADLVDKVLDDQDEYCKDYDNMIKCLIAKGPTICQG